MRVRLLSVLATLAGLTGLFMPGAQAATYRLIYSFGSHKYDGAAPHSNLLDVGGLLYGTTTQGGVPYNQCPETFGTVFAINPMTGKEAVRYTFGKNVMFGCGDDGWYPYAGLTNVLGTLYGTTYQGGKWVDQFGGTAYSFNPKTGAESILYSFGSPVNAEENVSGLINVGGLLYGTTVLGGNYPATNGTIYSLNPKSGQMTILHSFAASQADGMYPFGGLLNVGGTLYGTTSIGGSCFGYDCGIVFSFTPATNTYSIVYSFKNGKDGAGPGGTLLKFGDALYGTTSRGGAHGFGTVFKIELSTGKEAILHSFGGGNDGAYPYAGLTEVAGTLYGVTSGGGCSESYESGGSSTLFSINPATGTEAVLHVFGHGLDGNFPCASLLNVGGTLYGTTSGGGVFGDGTVFGFTP